MQQKQVKLQASVFDNEQVTEEQFITLRDMLAKHYQEMAKIELSGAKNINQLKVNEQKIFAAESFETIKKIKEEQNTTEIENKLNLEKTLADIEMEALLGNSKAIADAEQKAREERQKAEEDHLKVLQRSWEFAWDRILDKNLTFKEKMGAISREIMIMQAKALANNYASKNSNWFSSALKIAGLATSAFNPAGAASAVGSAGQSASGLGLALQKYQNFNIPQFKEGGPVPGSYSRPVPAILHGKEMVLTPDDQKNLLGMIRGGAGNQQQQAPVIINMNPNFQSLNPYEGQAMFQEWLKKGGIALIHDEIKHGRLRSAVRFSS